MYQGGSVSALLPWIDRGYGIVQRSPASSLGGTSSGESAIPDHRGGMPWQSRCRTCRRDPTSIHWHGTVYAQAYSLLAHVGGRPEYTDDRWLSNCFATLLEFMMTTSWPSSRQYTTGPVEDGNQGPRGSSREACAPYLFRHALYVSHGRSELISRTLPIKGRGFGPGGSGSPLLDREVQR